MGYSEEGDPAPGYAHVASGPYWSSAQAYCRLLQAVLRRDTRLLSESTWDLAMKDDLKPRGLSVPRPRVSRHFIPAVKVVWYDNMPALASGRPLQHCSPSEDIFTESI